MQEIEEKKVKREEETVFNRIPSAEEVEEEEEPEDRKEALEAECMETKECAPVKARFDTCQERVMANADSEESEETCVEEFFDLMHCVYTCSPDKLFHDLK